MTAGVMGLLPRLRYILVTDSLMQALSEEELNAVMAHEVAHVKYKHMLFYVLFLLGYLALSFGIFEFFPYAVAAQPWLWHLTQGKGGFQAGMYLSAGKFRTDFREYSQSPLIKAEDSPDARLIPNIIGVKRLSLKRK